MKFVKVRMLCDTNHKGFKKANEIHHVDIKTAYRWIENRIAESVELEPEQNQFEDDQDDEDDQDKINYLDMSAKQLFEICKNHKLEVRSKQSKEVYIEALEKAGIIAEREESCEDEENELLE